MAAGELSDAEIQSAMADILREGELSTLTSRIVRTQLEEKFGVSFLGRKKEIDKMLMQMIESFEKTTEDEKEQENGTNEMNGVETGEGDQEHDSLSEDHEPSAKKMKKVSNKESHELNDAELARKLHENEKGLRTRRQRTKKTVERKKPTKAKKPRENKGFGKLMALSPVLVELVGQEMNLEICNTFSIPLSITYCGLGFNQSRNQSPLFLTYPRELLLTKAPEGSGYEIGFELIYPKEMSRGDVVKKMWQIIRERKLEDPKNKRYTICDEQLRQVFVPMKLIKEILSGRGSQKPTNIEV